MAQSSAVRQIPSSFGPSGTTTGQSFNAHLVASGERFQTLDRKQSFYDCTQHDSKQYDFDGRLFAAGGIGQPLISAAPAPYFVSLRSRRPCAPYRLGRVIVNAFTTLLFGEQRWPAIRVDGDEEAQDFAEALSKACRLPLKMIEARKLGGGMGTVGLSWCYVDGQPRVQVHNAKHLFVHEWEDREELVPGHVTEIYKYPREQWNPAKKQVERTWWWYRRDWTLDADVAFQPVPFLNSTEPEWVIDEEKSVQHDDGFCHFVWGQNLPSDDIDGEPDCEGLWDNFDTVDLLNSVLVRGTTLNLDPTLVLKMDREELNYMGVKKGSDNALTVGETGDAHYLEIGGGAVTAGTTLFDQEKNNCLEVAQCVLPDSDKVAANGTSAVALKIVYAPMLGKTDILREQYGDMIRRLLEQMIAVARARWGETIITTDDEGNEVESIAVVVLPPRYEEEDELDEETGDPTGEKTQKAIERTPGEGGDLSLMWGPYFQATPDDQTKTITNMNMATGGAAILSKDTAVEIAASMFSRDPNEEKRRLAEDEKAKTAATGGMFGDITGALGGKVGSKDELPPGAKPKPGAPPFGAAPGAGGAAKPEEGEDGGKDAGAEAKAPDGAPAAAAGEEKDTPPAAAGAAAPPTAGHPAVAGGADPEKTGETAPGAEGAKPGEEKEDAPPAVTAHKSNILPKHPVAEAMDAAGKGQKKPTISADDLAHVMTVNEARSSAGLGDLLDEKGEPHPHGNLTVAEMKAARAPTVAAGAAAEKGQKKPSDKSADLAAMLAAKGDKPDIDPATQAAADAGDPKAIAEVAEAEAEAAQAAEEEEKDGKKKAPPPFPPKKAPEG